MQYTLTLDERTVQFLVDQLRCLPHKDVDHVLQAIRSQCDTQDRAQHDALRASLRAEMQVEIDAPPAVA
jgi:hypothetical protein